MRINGSVLPAVILIFLMPEFGFSQDLTIQARVLDTESREPVPFVSVFLDATRGTISDDQGFFRFPLDRDDIGDSLYLSCIGYLKTSVAISELNRFRLDTVYMTLHLIELDEVEVATRSRRPPGYRKILKRAIEAIPENYPDFPVRYRTYYREYIKEKDRYLNLLESIIELEDPGINNPDEEFSAGMSFKRSSASFETDSVLMVPYDNAFKFIPYSVAPTKTGNELVMLRAHDPVRNFDKDALYFIDNLEKEFIRNHIFEEPKLAYLDERPYYRIPFRNRYDNHVFIARVYATGTIFIDALNFGIKKISYRGIAERAGRSSKLFELNLEYRLEDELYYLNYLSFNNLFSTSNFCIKWMDFNPEAGSILVTFNRGFDPEKILVRDNYRIKWKGREMIIRNIIPEPEIDRISIELIEGEKIQQDLLEYTLNRDIMQGRIITSRSYFQSNLDLEINNLTDTRGNELKGFKISDYYQYRELFVKEHASENTTITRNLVDKQRPAFETKIFGSMDTDTSWLNTPLISEVTVAGSMGMENREFLEGLHRLNQINKKLETDLVYIHTDAETYAPADTVWFKAYVRDRARLRGPKWSQAFMLGLVNSEGTLVQQGTFMIEDDDVIGQLALDNALPEGMYFLTGYSSWMKNFGAEGIFSKRILIRKDVREKEQLVASYDRKEYFPGDTVRVRVNCYNERDAEVEDVGFSLRIMSGDDVLHRIRGNTSTSGREPLEYIIPDGLTEAPRLRLDAIHRGIVLDTVYRMPVNYRIQVDFYPEGGHLVNGLKSRVAFKSTNSAGDAVSIEGVIRDHDGKKLAELRTEHEGMGEFDYTPEKGTTAALYLTTLSDYVDSFPLPEGRDSGWNLSIKNTGNYLNLTIRGKRNLSDTVLLTFSVRGYSRYHRIIKVGGRESIQLPVSMLPPGIAVVTLYDSRMIPRAERLVLTRFPAGMDARIDSDRQHYIPRDSVRLEINVDQDLIARAGGSFSLSVVDDQLCSADFLQEPDIRTSFLMSPEIKGHINNPGYYLQTGNRRISQHLDLLLMTQGWRDYEFILDRYYVELFPTPVDQDVISGQVTRQQINRDDVPAQGTLSVYYKGEYRRLPLDEEGRFSFLPVYYPGESNSLFLSAEDERGRENVIIRPDSSLLEAGLQDYLLYQAKNDNTPVPVMTYENITDRFSLGIENHKWIEEVRIVGQREPEIRHEEGNYVGTRTPGELEMETSTSVYELLLSMGVPAIEELPEEGTSYVLKHNGYPWEDVEGTTGNVPATIMWMVDGVQTEYLHVRNINPLDIEALYVVYYPETQNLALFRIGDTSMYIPKVVVTIHTKPRTDWVSYEGGSSFITPRFVISKKFYKTSYKTPADRYSSIPDLRKTIHWEPDLEIDEEGTAVVRFYNGDRYTRIKCILEGITDLGTPVYGEYFYNVSLMRE